MEAELQRTEERKARAFKAFQDAARNKESDPETFEAARSRYYYLTKGPAWWEQEKKRLAAEKLDPVIGQYRDMYTSLESEATVQKAYTDSIAAVRDNRESLKGEADRQVSYFERLLQTEEQKKSAFDRSLELMNQPVVEPAATQSAPWIVEYFSMYPSSFKTILDIVLGVLIVAILVFAVRKTSVFMSWRNRGMAPIAPSRPITLSLTPSVSA
jgi:hypothetical protein